MLRIFSLLVVVVCLINQSNGDLVWVEGETAPRSGCLLEREDSGDIRWLDLNADSGQLSEIRFKSNQISVLTVTIDGKRLAGLEVADLAAWRDYGEELSSLSKDAYALNTAKRLFLLCLSHAEKRGDDLALVDSCIRNLEYLAASNGQRLRLRRLRKTLAGQALTRPGFSSDKLPSTSLTRSAEVNQSAVKEKLVTALKLLRQAEIEQAGSMLSAIPLAVQNQWLSDEFLEAVHVAIKGKKVGPDLLAKIVEIEFRLRFGSELPVSPSASDSFLNLVTTELGRYNGSLLFGVDVEATQFHQGRWRRPSVSAKLK